MPDLSEHKIWPKHASLHVCTVCACVPNDMAYDTTQHDMMHDRTWHMTWHDTWQDMTHDMLWHDTTLHMTQHDTLWHGVTQAKLCAQRSLACSPDSIDTFISLIRHNFPEIWAYACKHIACMHDSSCALGESFAKERSGIFSWFHRNFDLSDLTQFCQDMGPCT